VKQSTGRRRRNPEPHVETSQDRWQSERAYIQWVRREAKTTVIPKGAAGWLPEEDKEGVDE